MTPDPPLKRVVSKAPARTCPTLQEASSSCGAEEPQGQERRGADLRALEEEIPFSYRHNRATICRSAGGLTLECRLH